MEAVKELFAEFKELNEEEQFYKQYYEIKDDPKRLEAFIKTVDRTHMEKEGLWLPEIKYTSANYFTEYFLEDPRKNVEISMHNRYTPLFLHKHAFFEMIYVRSGQCLNTIEGNSIEMTEGDICVLAPDVHHTLGVFNDETLVFNIIIRRSTFKEIFDGVFTDDTALSLFFNRILYSNSSHSFFIFPSKEEKLLKHSLEFIILEGIKKEEYYMQAMENLLRTVFCLMLRSQEKIVLSGTLTHEHPKVLHILKYIQDNYKSVNMNQLAQHFKYSPDYLGKLIKKHTGTTFIKILRDIRFKKACNMLINTNLNVIDICYEIGYESVEYFNRTFKELCGMTPTEYRKSSSGLSKLPPSRRSIQLGE